MKIRELDVKVAECLGYAVITNYRHYGENCFVSDSAYSQFVKDYPHDQPPEALPHFSTTGEGMLRLIEEARKQGICLEFVHLIEGFRGEARVVDEKGQKLIAVVYEPVKSAQLAVTLAFLKAKGVDITPYLEVSE